MSGFSNICRKRRHLFLKYRSVLVLTSLKAPMLSFGQWNQ